MIFCEVLIYDKCAAKTLQLKETCLLYVFLSTNEFVRLSFCLQHQKIARRKIGYLGVKWCD